MQKKNKSQKMTLARLAGVILITIVIVRYLNWHIDSGAIVLAASPASKMLQSPTLQTPWGLAFDTANHTWVAEPGCAAEPVCAGNLPGTIGEYNTGDALLVHNYQQPTGFTGPLFLALDASSHLWFSEPGRNAIGELIPASRPIWKQWYLPTGAALPYQLLFDRTGNLWFSEFGSGKLGFFNPHTQHFVENALPTANSHPFGITLDMHGTIWVAENSVGKLASFTPNTNGKVHITEHLLPTVSPHLLTSDRQGHIWYSTGFYGKVGRYTPATGQISEYPVSRNVCHALPNCLGTHISGIAANKNGLIWFDDSLAQRVGSLNPLTGIVKVTMLGDPLHRQPGPHDGLAIDAQGNLWCTEEFANRLIKLPAPIPPKPKRLKS